MTRNWRAIVASAVVMAGLAGCHGQEKATGHGTVSGQILDGSVSDAMLPYDSVKSKAPLAPAETVGRVDDASENDAADDADSVAAAPDATAPDIAASPSPVAPAVAK